MATGFEDFADRMRGYGDRVVKNANALKRKAALAVDTAVVLSTPVDTGRARSNWQASLSAPAEGAIEAYSPGQSGSSASANANAALEQGKAVIGRSQPEEGIYLTNNLPYIGRLNDGHSAQAPAGFVQRAVLIGVDAIRKDADKLLTGNSDDGN